MQAVRVALTALLLAQGSVAFMPSRPPLWDHNIKALRKGFPRYVLRKVPLALGAPLGVVINEGPQKDLRRLLPLSHGDDVPAMYIQAFKHELRIEHLGIQVEEPFNTYRCLRSGRASTVPSMVGRWSARETRDENQRQRCLRSWLSLAIAPMKAHSPPWHHNSDASPSKLLEPARASGLVRAAAVLGRAGGRALRPVAPPRLAAF